MVPRKPEIDLINVMVCRYLIVLILSACVKRRGIYSVLYSAGCKYSCQTPPFHLQKYEQTLKYGFYLQEIWPPFCFLPQLATLSLFLPRCATDFSIGHAAIINTRRAADFSARHLPLRSVGIACGTH